MSEKEKIPEENLNELITDSNEENRFLSAQQNIYIQVIKELQNGKKTFSAVVGVQIRFCE